MLNQQVKNGSRVAIISANDKDGPFRTRLYVNNGETATNICKKAQTLKGALKQAQEMLK